MSQNGNEDISIVKKDLVGQKLGTTYYANLEFAHEFVGGETEIDFNSLNLPSVASIEGFTNHLPSRYIEAAITQNRGNVFLHSSSRGQLQRFTEFFIRENNKIRLNYTAEPNEIITGVLNSTIRSTPAILDVKKIDVTGTLAEGTTTFNVGQEYNVNSNPSTQLGELKVYRWQGSEDPKLMLRCVGNNLANVGNYIEVNNTIEFKEAGRVGGENIVVFSTSAVATQPKEGFSQELQTIGGQVDLISEFLQDVHGLPTNPFQAAANQVDLRAFGQKVVDIFGVIFGSISIPTSFLNKLLLVFGITSYQTKILSADVTVTSDVNDLQFNNLVIGNEYRISGVVKTSSTSGNAALNFRDESGGLGNVYGISSVYSDGGSQDISNTGVNIPFTATSTTLYCRATLSGGCSLGGNGTRGNTFITLEELPNHVETTKFN